MGFVAYCSLAIVMKKLTQVEVTQGGIGPAGLSTEDLHVLDLTQAKPRWHRWGLKFLSAFTSMWIVR